LEQGDRAGFRSSDELTGTSRTTLGLTMLFNMQMRCHRSRSLARPENQGFTGRPRLPTASRLSKRI